MKTPEFLEELLDAGIEVTMRKSDKLGVYFDLNTMAKSHMYLYNKDNQWRVAMRYDEDFPVYDVGDLKDLARHAMHNRDYINASWAEFMLTNDQREQRRIAHDALSRLSDAEQQAIKEYLR